MVLRNKMTHLMTSDVSFDKNFWLLSFVSKFCYMLAGKVETAASLLESERTGEAAY